MSLQKELSVFIPVRDGENHIAEAIESVRESTFKDWELIIADHGSIDDTSNIIAELAAHDDRIIIVNFERTLPFPIVLEKGRHYCQTPFLARMDADDVMHANRLHEDMAMLSKLPHAAVVSSQVQLFPASDIKEGMALYLQWQNKILTPAEHEKEIWIEQTICQPAATMRQTALDDVGGYRDGPFPEDYDLFVRLHLAGYEFHKRPLLGHYWRRHQQSISVVSDDFHQDAFALVKARGLAKKFNFKDRPVCILGSGRHGGRIARLLIDLDVKVDAFFDVSPKRIGSTRHGVPILPQQQLASWKKKNQSGFAIGAVGIRGRRHIVRDLLQGAGFNEPLDTVCIA